MRDFLGGFDFRGDMVTHPVGRFSGGEKARLTLALLVRQKPNLLLLDEPTNHLDIEMREALAEALQDYDGALIVVAHDRHLLRATTDALWLVADGAVTLVRRRSRRLSRLGARARRGARTSQPRRRSAVNRKAQKRAEALERQRDYAKRKPFADRLAKLDVEISALDAERKAVEEWLATPEAYADDAQGRAEGAPRAASRPLLAARAARSRVAGNRGNPREAGARGVRAPRLRDGHATVPQVAHGQPKAPGLVSPERPFGCDSMCGLLLPLQRVPGR